MGEQENAEVTDQPIGKSWTDDWARAEQQADARAEARDGEQDGNGKGMPLEGENVGEEGRQEQSSGGASFDGSEESEGGSGEESTEADGSSQSGEESSGGDLGDDGEREVSQSGRERRDGEEELTEKAPRAERLKQLRSEAKDLGLEFDGNAVMVADRAKFREEKRTIRSKLAIERETFEAEARAIGERIEQQTARAKRLETAIESNDLDEIAQAVGMQTWNHLSEAALKRQMNPEHKELMLHRREARERGERIKAEEAQQQTQAAQQKKAQARQNYRADLRGKVEKSKKYGAFADDPLFISGVLQHQEKNWDGEETISIDEASELAMKDARAIYDKLHQRFGSRTASQSEKQHASGASSTETPRRKSSQKTVSRSEVADASPDENVDELDQKAWAKKWAFKLSQSDAS